MRKPTAVLFALALLVLTGCTDSSTDDTMNSPEGVALDLCLTEVSTHFSVHPVDVVITEDITSDDGAKDWRGEAGDGMWECTSSDGTTLTSAIAYAADGMPTTLVVE